MQMFTKGVLQTLTTGPVLAPQKPEHPEAMRLSQTSKTELVAEQGVRKDEHLHTTPAGNSWL